MANKSMQQRAEDKARIAAVEICARKAREFVRGLKPGDEFHGLGPEAEKYFEKDSPGYFLFVTLGMFEFGRITITVNDQNIIQSVITDETHIMYGVH